MLFSSWGLCGQAVQMCLPFSKFKSIFDSFFNKIVVKSRFITFLGASAALDSLESQVDRNLKILRDFYASVILSETRQVRPISILHVPADFLIPN